MEFFSSLPQLFHRGECADMLKCTLATKAIVLPQGFLPKNLSHYKKGAKKIETQVTVWSSTLPWIRFQKIELRRHNYDLTLFPDTSSFFSKKRHPCKLITSAKLFLTNLCEHQAQVGQKLAIQRIRIWEINWLIHMGREFILWKALSTFWTTGASMLTTLTSNEIE